MQSLNVNRLEDPFSCTGAFKCAVFWRVHALADWLALCTVLQGCIYSQY